MLPKKKKKSAWQSRSGQGRRRAHLESFLSCSCPQPPTWGAEKSDWLMGRLWGTAVSHKIPVFKLGASHVYAKISANGHKALKPLMKGACWLQWNQGSSTGCVSSPSPHCLGTVFFVFLNNKLIYMHLLVELTYTVHASVYKPSPAWVHHLSYLLFLCVHVVAKCRLLVDLNSSDLKKHLARGQTWRLAWWQGKAESLPPPDYSLSFITASPSSSLSKRLQISSSAGCQSALHLASGKAHFSGHLFFNFCSCHCTGGALLR